MVRYYPDELYHHGILGMKWGVRRYQNPDGTRTELGKRRERTGDSKGRKAAKTAGKVALGVLGATAAKAAYDEAKGKPTRKFTKEDFEYYFTPNQPDGKDKPKVSRAEQMGKKAVKTAESASRVVGRFEDKKARKAEYERREKQREKVKKMSDDELRTRINRLNLEKQYLDLSRPESDPNAWTKQEKIDLGTDVLNGLLSAGALAISIYGLKKGIRI